MTKLLGQYRETWKQHTEPSRAR